jgi:hypothetical protein
MSANIDSLYLGASLCPVKGSPANYKMRGRVLAGCSWSMSRKSSAFSIRTCSNSLKLGFSFSIPGFHVAASALGHFQAKWTLVRVKEMRSDKDLERFSDAMGSENAHSPDLLVKPKDQDYERLNMKGPSGGDRLGFVFTGRARRSALRLARWQREAAPISCHPSSAPQFSSRYRRAP